MNHSVVRFWGGGPKKGIVAAPKPPVLLSFKSHIVVGSATSAIKQEALCGEQKPLWEQRGERVGEMEGMKKMGGVGEGEQTWTTDQELLLPQRGNTLPVLLE